MKRFFWNKVKSGLIAMLLIGLFFVVGTSQALAATSGWNNPTVGASSSATGTTNWVSPENITIVGSPYATMVLPTSTISRYLKGTGYGFNIPANATINGITVRISRSSSGTGSPLIVDNVVSLVKNGAIVGSNAASATGWPYSLTEATYGSASSLWGETWTPADINNANFGVVLSAVNEYTVNPRSLNVDYMQITVDYTPAPVSASGSSVTVSNNIVNTSGGASTIRIMVKDQFGDPMVGIPSAKIGINASGIGNTITRLSSETDADGVYTAMLQSTAPQTKTVSTTVNDVVLNDHPTVDFYSSAPAKATITATPLTQEASLSGSVISLDTLVADGYDNTVPDGNPIWIASASTAPHGTPTTNCPQTSQVYTVAGHVSCLVNFNYKGDVTLRTYGSNGILTGFGNTTVHFVDTTKPVITLTGNSRVTTEYRGTYTDLGATANDNIDLNITPSIVTVNPVDTNTVVFNPAHDGKVVGTYTVTYNVKDGSNNNADQVTRTVNVIDTTAPVVTSLTSDATATGWLKVGGKIKFTLALAPAEPLAAVAGSYNGQTLAWTSADAGATYTATYTVVEGDNDHKIAPLQISGITVTDVAGNETTVAGTDVEKNIDAHTPVAPTASLPAYINLANVASVPMTVAGEVGTTVHYTVGSVTGSGVVGSDGSVTFDLNLSALPQGAVVASVTLTDAAGNVSSAGTAGATKDTLAPAAPVVSLPVYVNTLNQAASTISGTGEVSAVIRYTITDSATGEVTGTASVTPGTTIHFSAKDLSGLLDGTLSLTATQTDLAGNTSEASVVTTAIKETIKPTLASLDSDGKRFSIDSHLITAAFSETVTAPKIAVTYSAVNGDCVNISATAMTATADPKVFRYNLAVSDACLAALGNVTISNATDVAGNIIDADNSHNFNIDTVSPDISDISPDHLSFIKADFTVGYKLSEDLENGTINFNDGEHIYTLSADQLKAGTHVISNASLLAAGVNLNEGLYTVIFHGVDLAGNEGNASVEQVTYDVTSPVVQNVTSDKADGFYKAGEVINVSVKFSEPVNVTGNPYFTLATGNTDRNANYKIGSGTDSLTFVYTVQPGDTSADLDYLSTNALALNGQSISDRAGNDANLTLATPGAANSLGFNKNLVIDTTAPTVVLATIAPNPTNTSPIPVTATFSEPVTGFESADITVGNGSVSNFAGSGTTYTFDVTPTVDGSVTMNIAGGAAIDAAGNGNVAAAQLVLVYDFTKPEVTAVTLKEGSAAYDGVVKAGDVLTIEAAFSEPIAVSPTPTIAISGNNTLAATAMTRVDATHYTYNYTVATPGNGDATITIADGKDLAANVLAINAATKFVVDNTKPIIDQHATVTETANDLGGKVVVYTVIANDNHDGSMSAVCTPASGTKFAVSQITPVTCNVTDQAGNVADAMTFNIIVNPDVIARLLVSGTTPHKTNETSAISVTGKDQYGNITTNQSGTMAVVNADNGAVLGNTILTLANGTAATTLQKATAGITTVTVSSGSLIPGNTQVEFTQVDTTGPVVSEIHPALGAVDVSISAPSFIIFNEVLKLSSVNSGNVQLWKAAVAPAAASQISATVSLVEGGKRVNITPDSPLDYDAAYYFVVTGGVTDEAGNALTTTKDSSNTGFTTAKNMADLIAPTITAHNPSSDAAVSVNTAPSVTFSEALKPGSVSSVTAQLFDVNNEPVPAAVSLVEGGTRIIITPSVALASNATYHFGVTTGITDEAGNALAEGANYTFTTLVPSDVTAPIVINFVAGAITDSGANLSVTTNENAVCRYADTEKDFADMAAMSDNNGTVHTQALSGLKAATSYNYYVRCQDAAGNTMNASAHTFFITKTAVATGVSVDAVSMTKSIGAADDTYANGWEWRFLVTLPDAENGMALKFADWTSGANTLLAGGNMEYYSEQIGSGLGSAANPVAITAANTYPGYIYINPSADVAPGIPGVQTYVRVKMKIPATTVGGSYGSSYQAASQAGSI